MGLLFLQWGFFLLSVGLVIYWGKIKPTVLISLLAGAIAIEISITWFPPLGAIGSQLGSLARLLTVGIIGAALWQLWIDPRKRQELQVILKHFLTRALMIYIAVGAISILYTVGPGKTALEVVRLLTLCSLYLSIGILVERKHVLLPFQVVHWVGVALVPLALYEAMTRHFIWREYLAEGMIARVNATFVDPNIFARYLVLAIVANLILMYLNTSNITLFSKTKTNTKGWTKVVYLGSLLGLLGALAITLSRSGLLTLVIVLILMLILIPRKRMILPISLLGLVGAVIISLSPKIWNRLLTFKDGFSALDDMRRYLVKVAWEMFKDHPILGVGLGGFERMFKTHYIHLKIEIPDAEGATLSHTSILTIASELGIIGLAALTWVWLTLLRVLWQLRKASLEHSENGNMRQGERQVKQGDGSCVSFVGSERQENRPLVCASGNGLERYVPGVGYFLWITTVFISSQAEARFFEDPIIWISMAMMLRLLDEIGSEKNGPNFKVN